MLDLRVMRVVAEYESHGGGQQALLIPLSAAITSHVLSNNNLSTWMLKACANRE